MKVLIFGNGGHARVVADILATMEDMEPAGFVYSGLVADDETISGIPVINETSIPTFPHDAMVIALGDTLRRKTIHDKYIKRSEIMTSAVHPSAIIASDVTLGPGCMVCAGVVINSGTTIGPNTILNTGCTIDHDGVIGSHVHIAPGVNIAGSVSVNEGVFLGIGSCVIQGLTIGAWSIVGAGAAVIRDIPSNATVTGVPAR